MQEGDVVVATSASAGTGHNTVLQSMNPDELRPAEQAANELSLFSSQDDGSALAPRSVIPAQVDDDDGGVGDCEPVRVADSDKEAVSVAVLVSNQDSASSFPGCRFPCGSFQRLHPFIALRADAGLMHIVKPVEPVRQSLAHVPQDDL